MIPKKPGTTSRYVGVDREASSDRFHASVRIEGKRYRLGTWHEERSAALARDRGVLFLKPSLPLNLPKAAKKLGPESPEQLRRIARSEHRATMKPPTPRQKRKGGTSKYLGVSRRARGGRFKASVFVRWKNINLGTWSDEKDAALARDRAVLFLKLVRVLNLPSEAKKLGPESPEQLLWLSRKKLKDMGPFARSRKKSKAAGYTSPFFGVMFESNFQRWAAIIRTNNGKRTRLGHFAKPEVAAIAYDRVARSMFGKKAALNFPDRKLGPASVQDMRAWAHQLLKAHTASRFRGVVLVPKNNRSPWAGQLMINGNNLMLGVWSTEREAALAYDRGALHYFGDAAVLNFPDEARALGPLDQKQLCAEATRRFKETTTSQYRGVCWIKTLEQWRAEITHDNRHYDLGRFDIEEEAAEAYDKAAKRLKGKKAKLNFP